MKKVFLCLCFMIVIVLTGCSTKSYYCNDGDTLIGNSCLHKSTYQAKPFCKAGYFYNPLYQKCCFEGGNRYCYVTTEFRCNDDDILSGQTCHEETYYDAYER